jgi:hypothetical protein
MPAATNSGFFALFFPDLLGFCYLSWYDISISLGEIKANNYVKVKKRI